MWRNNNLDAPSRIKGVSKEDIRRLIFIIIAVFAAAKSIHAANKKADLDNILTKCAEYCDRLGNTVLDITCIEKIEERIYLQSHFFKKK